MMQDQETAAIAAKDEVRAVISRLHEAFYDRDAEAVGKTYTADARVADLAPLLMSGFDEANLALWLSSWGGPVEVSTHDMKIMLDGDLAVSHGLVHVKTRTKDDQEAEWWMRSTICLRRENGDWKIFHEHESVPFYMDGSFRAALDLTP